MNSVNHRHRPSSYWQPLIFNGFDDLGNQMSVPVQFLLIAKVENDILRTVPRDGYRSSIGPLAKFGGVGEQFRGF